MEWIISANLKMYDVIRAFRERTVIDWRQSATQQIGDVVYIYVGRPVQAILFQTIVEKVGIEYENAIPDHDYWVEDFSEDNSERHFMRLRLIETFPEHLFSLVQLVENGLMGAPQGPIKIKDELRGYLVDAITSHTESPYYEGKSSLKEHFVRERNQKLIDRAKQLFLDREGSFYCEACEFDFSKKYGDLGEGYIEAHHNIPISKMNENHESLPSDLAMLCSNCHRMIHRRIPWLTVEQLREKISDARNFKSINR